MLEDSADAGGAVVAVVGEDEGGGAAGVTAGDFCGDAGCVFRRFVSSGLCSEAEAFVPARFVPKEA